MAATVTLQNAMETLEALNNTTQTMTDTVNVPGTTDGLYIMINKMISDLTAIKIDIKVQERLIQKAVNNTIKSSLFAEVTATPDLYLIPTEFYSNSLHATYSLTSGLGGTNGTARHVGNGVANTFPGIYRNNAPIPNIYTESAVFSILAKAANIIKLLKNGGITASEGSSSTLLNYVITNA